MLFLSICHGVNSVIFVYRMDRKQKFHLDSSCMNKGLSFDILLEVPSVYDYVYPPEGL